MNTQIGADANQAHVIHDMGAQAANGLGMQQKASWDQLATFFTQAQEFGTNFPTDRYNSYNHFVLAQSDAIFDQAGTIVRTLVIEEATWINQPDFMPIVSTDKLVSEIHIVYFDEPILPEQVPAEGVVRTFGIRKEKTEITSKRYGQGIVLEHDFASTAEGRQKFAMFVYKLALHFRLNVAYVSLSEFFKRSINEENWIRKMYGVANARELLVRQRDEFCWANFGEMGFVECINANYHRLKKFNKGNKPTVVIMDENKKALIRFGDPMFYDYSKAGPEGPNRLWDENVTVRMVPNGMTLRTLPDFPADTRFGDTDFTVLSQITVTGEFYLQDGSKFFNIPKMVTRARDLDVFDETRDNWVRMSHTMHCLNNAHVFDPETGEFLVERNDMENVPQNVYEWIAGNGDNRDHVHLYNAYVSTVFMQIRDKWENSERRDAITPDEKVRMIRAVLPDFRGNNPDNFTIDTVDELLKNLEMNRTNMERFHQNNILDPFGSGYQRVNHRQQTSSVVIAIGGPGMGVANVGHEHTGMGWDVTTKTGKLSSTMWVGAKLVDPDRRLIVPNVFYDGLICGGGTKVMTADDVEDMQAKQFIDDEENSASLYAFVLPVGHRPSSDDVFDMRGYNEHLGLDQESEERFYITSEYYCKTYGFHQLDDMTYNNYMDDSPVTTYVWQGGQTDYKADGETKDQRIQSLGHNKVDYPGVAKVRRYGNTMVKESVIIKQ